MCARIRIEEIGQEGIQEVGSFEEEISLSKKGFGG